MLNIDFSGRVALVTGGSRGVGKAVACMFARAGADVVISYQSRDMDAERTTSELRQLGCSALAVRGDLSQPAAADDLVQRTISEFGRLDFVVANAGIWPPDYVDVAQMTDEQWQRTVAANLHSVFYTTRAAAKHIAEHGRIVFVSSTAGQRGEAGHVDYAATKGALISMVKGLCIEFAGRDITVNCVAPGWIDTEMAAAPYADGGRAKIEANIPLGRVASADDIAGPILFLCSPLARHITGEILNVNGGSVLCG